MPTECKIFKYAIPLRDVDMYMIDAQYVGQANKNFKLT